MQVLLNGFRDAVGPHHDRLTGPQQAMVVDLPHPFLLVDLHDLRIVDDRPQGEYRTWRGWFAQQRIQFAQGQVHAHAEPRGFG